MLPEQQALYLQEGFTGLVPKPLTLEQVEHAIAQVVPRAARAPQNVVVTAVPHARDRFDRDLIEQYRSVIGVDGAREMVDLFLRTLDERRVELGAAVDAGDLAETQRIGHALKGMSSAVGAARLSAAGAALQNADAPDVTRLLAEFDAEAAAAVAEVRTAWGLTAT